MIIGDRQVQKAGDNSQQMQAEAINISIGIDEKRVREICAETYAIARRDFTEDAYACANERVRQFENSLLPKMQQIEGAFNMFADPSFQLLLTSAQRTAVATERDADYDVLSELLVHRITKGQSRKNLAGISRAIEIVDKIDDDALCALTVVYAVSNISPLSGDFNDGVRILDDMFNKLIYMDLPNGTDWIEHLDILDAVRIDYANRFKKIEEIYPEHLTGYPLESATKAEFMVRWDRYPALNKLHQWWDNLPTTFYITHVGTALAHTNARRCDSTIPEFLLG